MPTWQESLQTHAPEAFQRIGIRLANARKISTIREPIEEVLRERTDLILGMSTDAYHSDFPELARCIGCLIVVKCIDYQGEQDSFIVEVFDLQEEARESVAEFMLEEAEGHSEEWNYTCRVFDLDTGLELEYEIIKEIRWR